MRDRAESLWWVNENVWRLNRAENRGRQLVLLGGIRAEWENSDKGQRALRSTQGATLAAETLQELHI